MQVITSEFVKNKKVVLRLDIDVPVEKESNESKVVITEDFRLKAGLPTLKLCLEYASEVVVMGHIGRPEGKVVEGLKIAPIVEWFKNQGYAGDLGSGKLKILENLRFDPREEACDPAYAKELAAMGDIYVNEAFGSYHQAVSTTILPSLLPHACGLRFVREVEVLGEVKDNPKKPFVVIMGGAKVKDKLPVMEVLARSADAVLVGGKLVQEIREQDLKLSKNVMVGMLTEDGFDIAPATISAWSNLISKAAQIIWNGPVGRIEDPNLGSAKGTYEIAKMILESKAESIVGGGDTVGFLGQVGLLKEFEEKGFVSVGGGAMLKFLTDGTLPTIEVLR